MDRIRMNRKIELGFYTPDEDAILLGSFRKKQVWYYTFEDMIYVEVVDPSIVRYALPRDRKKRVLEMQLSKSEDFTKAWHINMTRLDYRYTGQGIAAQAYRYLIKKLGIMLQAGNSQSRGGRKVWFDLAQIKDLTVLAQTKYGQAYDVDVNKNLREIRVNGRDLYDGERRMYVFASAAQHK